MEIKFERLAGKSPQQYLLLLVLGGYFVTTEVFTHLKARPQWNTSLLSPAFLLSAVLSGVAVFMLIRSFSRRPRHPAGDTTLACQRMVLLTLLAADVIIMLVKYYADKSNPLIPKVHSLFPFSYLIFLVIGNIIPIVLMLFYKRGLCGCYRLIPILVLLGVLLKRSETIITAFLPRWLPFAPQASYRPTLPEISIVLGIYSAAILALIIAFRFAKSMDLQCNSCRSDTIEE